MLASVFVLALAVLDAAAASTRQCKPKQLGKYAPLSSNRATQKYCAAYLHGKAPRSIEERAGRTAIECLQSDLKKEKKTYQSAICSCFAAPTTSTSRSTTASRTTTTSTTITTTTSATPSSTCFPNRMVQSDMCRYTEFCDQEITGEFLREPGSLPDEASCLDLCDSFNGGGNTGQDADIVCRGYNYNSSTSRCEILSSISGVDPAPGVISRQVLICACNFDRPTECGQQR